MSVLTDMVLLPIFIAVLAIAFFGLGLLSFVLAAGSAHLRSFLHRL